MGSSSPSSRCSRSPVSSSSDQQSVHCSAIWAVPSSALRLGGNNSPRQPALHLRRRLFHFCSDRRQGSDEADASAKASQRGKSPRVSTIPCLGASERTHN